MDGAVRISTLPTWAFEVCHSGGGVYNASSRSLTTGAELGSTGHVRPVVARRGASRPRKKDAKQKLPTRSSHSQPNWLHGSLPDA